MIKHFVRGPISAALAALQASTIANASALASASTRTLARDFAISSLRGAGTHDPSPASEIFRLKEAVPKVHYVCEANIEIAF
jgi:hypothetical protein